MKNFSGTKLAWKEARKQIYFCRIREPEKSLARGILRD
jgi:hypothetical protein